MSGSRGSAQRFVGAIAGAGTTSRTRLVVGCWRESPLGSFADVMVATADGRRVLLAPRTEVAELVAATYRFDEVRTEPVRVEAAPDGWRVRAPSLRLDLAVGGPTIVGRLLGLVPRRLARAPAWTLVTDPLARLVLPGVRTRGSAGGGRREYYGATGARAVTAARGVFDGADLGSLALVHPPPGFGFSSTPRRPTVTEVVTTIRAGR